MEGYCDKLRIVAGYETAVERECDCEPCREWLVDFVIYFSAWFCAQPLGKLFGPESDKG